MYIGTLCALQLGYPQWIIFYDADNFVPSALLEYTLAMRRLFMPATPAVSYQVSDALAIGELEGGRATPDLHNVRICWSSKPKLGSRKLHEQLLGRCTRVVSPLFNTLLQECFGIRDYAITSSNAGEQGMTIKTAKTLRFSSRYSVETFLLLDFLFKAVQPGGETDSAILQQYQAKSPHFHDKKGDEHIKKMIAESLGSFFHFEQFLSPKVRYQLQQVYQDFKLDLLYPTVYPALQDLPVQADKTLVEGFKLFQDTERREVVLVSEEVPCV